MKFSLMLFSSGEGASAAASYDAIQDIARFADRESFERIWLPERHFVRFGALHPNPATLGAALAVQTSRVRIAAGSVVAPLHDAIRIAEEWSVVDNLSRGRVDLAFAAGWRAEDFVLAPEGYAERRDVLCQRIQQVRALWRGESIERRTGGGATARVSTFPRPVQRELPLWVTAARSTETFELAGTLGANVLTYLVDLGFEALAERIAAYRLARTRAGHDADGGCVTVMLHTYLGADSASVRSRVEPGYKKYLVENRALFAHEHGATKGRALSLPEAEQLAAAQFERVFETLSLMGSVERCRQVVRTLQALGVSEIACLVDFLDDFAAIREALPFVADLRSRIAVPAVNAVQVEADGALTPAIRGEAADFYAYIDSIGGSYGPRFRLIDSLVADEAHALCTLRAVSADERAHARAVLMDAAVSTAHAIGMTPGLRASSRPLGLPVGIGRAVVLDAAPGNFQVRTQRRAGNEAWIEFDIEVSTAEGRPAMRLERVRFQRIPVTQSDPRQMSARALIHQALWQQQGDVLTGVTVAGRPLFGTVVVEAAHRDDESALVEAFHGMACTAYDARSFVHAAGESRGGEHVLPVLLAHPSSGWDTGDLEAPRAALARLESWVRTWSARPGISPAVVLVRGAHTVVTGDPPPDPCAAAGWAAATSLAASSQRRPLWVIDLDPNLPVAEQMSAVRALLDAREPGAVALRAGVCHAQHIQACAVEAEMRTAPLGPNVLITGGAGSLGRWLVTWLAEEGVRTMRLVSRNASRARPVASLLRDRATVELVDADLADAMQAARAVDGPAGGFDTVFHLAGDVVDSAGARLEPQTIERCFRPKLDGLVNLWRALAGAPPRRLVLFSSIAAVTGSAGQAAYAAANAAMAAAAQRLPGLEHVDVQIVCFGPWGGAGMASGAALESILAAKGVAPMPPWLALRALNCVLSSNRKSTLVAARAEARDGMPHESGVEHVTSTRPAPPALTALREAAPGRRSAMLESEIVRLVADIMDTDAARVDPRRNLYEIGFDSLMAIELKNIVLSDYGVEISLVDMMKSNTIAQIASTLMPLLLAAPERLAPAAHQEQELVL